jgi:hypothetical protein
MSLVFNRDLGLRKVELPDGRTFRFPRACVSQWQILRAALPEGRWLGRCDVDGVLPIERAELLRELTDLGTPSDALQRIMGPGTATSPNPRPVQ